MKKVCLFTRAPFSSKLVKLLEDYGLWTSYVIDRDFNRIEIRSIISSLASDISLLCFINFFLKPIVFIAVSALLFL